jgi:chemotaxis family two-component system response regulator Rcp1
MATRLHIKQQGRREMIGKSLRMLVIEDSPSDIRLLQEAVKENGIHCEMAVARDGMQGLAYLQKVSQGSAARPDLIILDLNLPLKNGREVLSEIKTAPDLKQIPVVVMTSSQADEDVNEAYTLNANCFITKPYSLDDYVEILRSIDDFWAHTATLPDVPFARADWVNSPSDFECRNPGAA